MDFPRALITIFHGKGTMASWPFSRRWRVSDPILFQVTLAAALLATVLGKCGPPPYLQFASPISELNETEFETGTTLKYNCRPGYRKITAKNHVLTCESRGTWNYIEFCVKKQCGNPGELLNGQVKVKTDYSLGSQIEFSCSEGYVLVGPTTSYCEIQEKGVGWSEYLPRCMIVKCEPPPAISNGKHNGGDEDFYTYGSSVTYSCDPDFSMLGKASISCSVENKTIGVWSPKPPTCKNIVCNRPQVPNGIIVSGFGSMYIYKDSLMFSCEEGYILKGSSVIYCEADNKWNPSPPVCKLNSCIGLPHIPYAVLDGSYRLRNQKVFEAGTEVKYECITGYRPIPDEPLTVTCQENFTWTPSKGCERVCCPAPALKTIRVISGRTDFPDRCEYAYGDNVLYTCDRGYDPVIPHGRSSCTSDGTWKPEMPACKPAVCMKPEIKNGKLSEDKEKYVVFETVIVQCDSEYDLFGPANITCSENKTWHPEVPKCWWANCHHVCPCGMKP
uniref:Sushi domain-containing protein n=1 Tax=Sus scrofa TaxID=9823 RepID=A0A8D1M0N6_PIG